MTGLGKGNLSSYTGMGDWTLKGDTLTLLEGNGRVNHFKVNGDGEA